ncbi:MAG: HAD family hydrolase [Gammaproteobacteria bacterium]
MLIKLVCFDLDNTLWPVDPVIARAEEQTWRWLAERAPELAAGRDIEALRAIRLGLLRSRPEYAHNLTALRRDAMAVAFMQAGLTEPAARDLAAAAMAVFLEHRNAVTFFPGARELLEALAGRYRLAALTNGNADLARIGADHLFDVVLSSESVGRAKPDPAMFRRALADTGVAARDALHVGDHPEQDVLAARRHGLGAVWANPLRLPRPSSLPDDVPAFEDYNELECLLGEFGDRETPAGGSS